MSQTSYNGITWELSAYPHSRFLSPFHQNNNTFLNTFTTMVYSDFQIPIHFHRNLEFVIALEGEGVLSINKKEYPLKPKECALILPYQFHGLEVPENAHIWITTFSQHYVKAFLSSISGKRPIHPVFQLSDTTEAFLIKQLLNPAGGNKIFSELDKETELMVKACFYAVCSEFTQKVELISGSKEAEAISVDILQYISTNFRENISLRTAAKELGYNYQYLSRIFNQTVGINFKTILNQYRFEYAMQLLRETDKSITTVAFESGFQSLRTFNRVSYEMFNTSPNKLRKETK